MQKFVVVKNAVKPPTRQEAATQLLQVKMSGYLKKKRKKMGGWRKLWFVLQNQLLLSYSSREDYEKKLVPFKDVVSLVPGTIIRPTKGPRFIIETSTNLIFTYRCDDNKTCSEWITALVDSLSLGAQAALDNKLHNQTKLHYSLDNLPQTKSSVGATTSAVKKQITASRSWDSICRSKSATKAAPNLPIAQSTARILKRNGLQPNDANGSKKFADKTSLHERVRNFRLHQNDLKTNQSYEVHRINSMFISGMSTAFPRSYENKHNFPTNEIVMTPPPSKTNDSDRYAKISNNRYQHHLQQSQQHSHQQLPVVLPYNGQRNVMVENCENRSIEEQVQRISLDDDDDDDGGNTSTPSLMNPTADHKHKLSSPALPLLSTSFGQQQRDRIAETKADTKRLQPSQTHTEYAHDRGNGNDEPIYAVVDLKNKYARRAKLQALEDQIEKERPKSFHVSSSDYEEVMEFRNGMGMQHEDENENIYEPINIPDELSPKSPMWKYFSKINIETLVEITKRKRPIDAVSGNAKDEPTAFSDIRKRWGNHRKSIKNRMRKFYAKDASSTSLAGGKDGNSGATRCSSSLSDDDLGSQGASCSTTSSTTTTNSSRSADLNSFEKGFVMNEISKYRKGEKHIFGSLGRLRKSRTSLCLEELSPRKKLVVASAGSASSSSFASKNQPAEFQHELKQKVNRRCPEAKKKDQCHSRFYD